MPSRRIHKLISKALVGEDGDSIHKWIDEPHKWLGPNHRKVRHDLKTVALLTALKGPKAGKHAALHILTDRSLSKPINQMKNKIYNTIKDLILGK